MTTVIEFEAVSKIFSAGRGSTPVNAIDDVSIEVRQGSIVGVIGYSGAGKSTLVRMINGLELPTSGTVRVLGVDVGRATEEVLRSLRSRVGMIFQHFNLFNSRTVHANVAYPLRVAGWKKADRDRRVDELLAFVGIQDKAQQYPRRLSGGQKQRVGIARAIATDPEILLADEATSALDPQTTAEVLALLKEVNKRLGITIVVITHQISIVQELCDEVFVMEAGRVVERGDTYGVFAHPRAELTRRFVAAVTPGAPSGTALAALESGGGSLVSVEVNEFTADDAAAVFERHGARAAVVYGGVTEVLGRQLGKLSYRVHADAPTLGRIVDELAAQTAVQLPSTSSALELTGTPSQVLNETSVT